MDVDDRKNPCGCYLRALIEAWWSLWTAAVIVRIVGSNGCKLGGLRAGRRDRPMFDSTGRGRICKH